jgi:cellulose synthase/poly-beta-1,6-N-acetylglucosamine synthase-like glycosyltransferase
LRSLQRLDYPSEKLDIILVLEPDDLRTRAAVARARRGPQVQVLIAQATGPKTKPKALNVALPFVRGSFLTVFDAEDDPDPGQLRAALGMFRQHNDDVACVQAGLHFDNLTHSLLSRMAAVEYAGLFAVFLPGLVALGMPLPLGGTSNHFRTDTLRRIGGWDAYNVTEDADLGIRLARLGYRSVTIPSVTLEEAPIAFGAWLRQRSRWMKGWMQTWAVHMRDPRKLWNEAGARGFLALNIVFGGNILTSLAFTVLVVKLIACLLLADSTLLLGDRLSSLHVLAIACGFIATCILGLTGLMRRGRLRDGWILALTPIYWGCLSIATWRALWQFWTRRHHWEKTEHGLVHRTGTMAASRGRPQR